VRNLREEGQDSCVEKGAIAQGVRGTRPTVEPDRADQRRSLLLGVRKGKENVDGKTVFSLKRWKSNIASRSIDGTSQKILVGRSALFQGSQLQRPSGNCTEAEVFNWDPGRNSPRV